MQRLALSVLGDLSMNGQSLVEFYLQEHPLIDAYEKGESGQFLLSFTGNDDDAADLLGVLVSEGIRVREFRSVKETLQDIFLKLGHQKTS
ncbi:MAG: DUF4162 domain-containing protein [Cyanobacteria bacterium J06635_11]